MRLSLLDQIRAAGLPDPEPEARFHSSRKWRFDYSWKELKVAVERQGGTWQHGKHVRGAGYRNDCVKAAEAQLLGWLVIWVTADMERDGTALDLIERALKARGGG